MKIANLRLFAITALVALVLPIHAQELSSNKKGIATAQDATTVAVRISQLNAQLDAVQKETLRRLQCQADTQVSTATGCQEVPGLRSKAEYLLAKQRGLLPPDQIPVVNQNCPVVANVGGVLVCQALPPAAATTPPAGTVTNCSMFPVAGMPTCK